MHGVSDHQSNLVSSGLEKNKVPSSIVIAPLDTRTNQFIKMNEELEQFMAMNDSKYMQ